MVNWSNPTALRAVVRQDAKIGGEKDESAEQAFTLGMVVRNSEGVWEEAVNKVQRVVLEGEVRRPSTRISG